MRNPIALAESVALDAWNVRLNTHSAELTAAAADAADRDVSMMRGLNPNDYEGHGAEVRAAWYVAATEYVDEHCRACVLLGPVEVNGA